MFGADNYPIPIGQHECYLRGGGDQKDLCGMLSYDNHEREAINELKAG